MGEPEGNYMKGLEGLIEMVVETMNGVKFDMLVHVESIDVESIHQFGKYLSLFRLLNIVHIIEYQRRQIYKTRLKQKKEIFLL